MGVGYSCCGGERPGKPIAQIDTRPLLETDDTPASPGRVLNKAKGNLQFESVESTMNLPEIEDRPAAPDDTDLEQKPFIPHAVRLSSVDYADGGELDSSRRPKTSQENLEQIAPAPALDGRLPSQLVITYDNAEELTPRFIQHSVRRASTEVAQDSRPQSGLLSPTSAGGSRAVSGALEEDPATESLKERYGLAPPRKNSEKDLNVRAILTEAEQFAADSDDEEEKKGGAEGKSNSRPSSQLQLPSKDSDDSPAETGSGGRNRVVEPLPLPVAVPEPEPEPEPAIETRPRTPSPVPVVVEPPREPTPPPQPEPVVVAPPPEPVPAPAPEPAPLPPPKPAVKASGIRLTTVAPSTAVEGVAEPPKPANGIRLTTVSTTSAAASSSQEGVVADNKIKPVTAFRFATVDPSAVSPASVQPASGTSSALQATMFTVATPEPANLDFSEIAAAAQGDEEMDALKSPRGAQPSTYTGFISRYSTFSRGRQAEELPTKDELMLWSRKKTRGYDYVQIHDLSGCWKNGMAFCALLHSFDPRSLNYDKLRPRNERENLDLAFATAEEKLMIPRSLDVEDVAEGIADEDEIYKYLLEWYKVIGQ